MKTDREKDFEEAYNQAWSSFGPWQDYAIRDLRAHLGDSYTAKEKHHLAVQGRDELNIQLIRRIVKWVSGLQRERRKTIKYDPIDGSDDIAASDFTAISRWNMHHNCGYETISNGFEHALKTGMSLINVFNDQDYNTKTDLMFYNQFLIDPSFTRLDLSDCHYGILRKYITKDQARLILPSSAAKKVAMMDDKHPNTDGKFPHYRVPTIYGRKLIPYDEFHQRTVIDKKYIFIKPTGKEILWEGTAGELNRIMQRIRYETGLTDDQITVITKPTPTVTVTGYVNSKEVSHNIDPFGIGDFSFTPILAYYDPEYDDMWLKLQGLVRCLVDPQRAENKRVSAMIAWFEAQMGSGLDYEEGTLVDEEDAFKSGPGKPRKFKKGAISGNRFNDRTVPDMPSGYVAIHQILNEAMPKMVNMNEEVFGNPTTNQGVSEVVQRLRVDQSLVGQKGLFDSLDLSQRIIGKKMLKLYQQCPIQKIERILGRKPAKEFYTKQFGEFDASVEESMLTSTQRNSFYSELLSLKRMGAEMQDPAPIGWDLILKNAPIQMRGELMEDILKKQQQAAKQQQESQALAKQLQMLNIEDQKSKIIENQTQAIERRTASEENRANAALDRAKTVNEIQQTSRGEIMNTLLEAERLQIERDKLDLERRKLALDSRTLTERNE